MTEGGHSWRRAYRGGEPRARPIRYLNDMEVEHRSIAEPPRPLGDNPAVWFWPDAAPMPAWMAGDVLTVDEKEREERYRHDGAREHFRRVRVLLRNVLGKDLRISIGEYGKPELVGSTVHFNLSHTAGGVALAVGPATLGLDLETPDPKRDLEGLVNRYFTPGEIEQYHGLPAELRPAAFLRGWTGKEALLKALGTGIRDLAHVAVDLDPRLPPRVLAAPKEFELFQWMEGQLAAALAVQAVR